MKDEVCNGDWEHDQKLIEEKTDIYWVHRFPVFPWVKCTHNCNRNPFPLHFNELDRNEK